MKELFRCETCGGLVTDRTLKNHAGHRIRHAYNGSLWEWILVKIGWYK